MKIEDLKKNELDKFISKESRQCILNEEYGLHDMRIDSFDIKNDNEMWYLEKTNRSAVTVNLNLYMDWDVKHLLYIQLDDVRNIKFDFDLFKNNYKDDSTLSDFLKDGLAHVDDFDIKIQNNLLFFELDFFLKNKIIVVAKHVEVKRIPSG